MMYNSVVVSKIYPIPSMLPQSSSPQQSQEESDIQSYQVNIISITPPLPIENHIMNNDNIKNNYTVAGPKYATLLPIIKDSSRITNMENDIKSKLNINAFKFLSQSESDWKDKQNNNTTTTNNNFIYSSSPSSSLCSSIQSSTKSCISSSSSISSFNDENINKTESININHLCTINSLQIPKETKQCKTKRRRGKKVSIGSVDDGINKSPSLKNINTNTNSNTNNNSIDDNKKASLEERRRFICKICTRGFTTSGHLARHNRIHTGEKNHECPYETCNQRFSRQDNCLQHYRTHFRLR